MTRTTGPAGTPWKWDTTLLHREGWKSGGFPWKLEDGTIVVRLGSMWEGGYYRDCFIQRIQYEWLCSRDNGVSWQEYLGPALHNAAELSDGTLVEPVVAGTASPRRDEMKALVAESLGVTEEDLSECFLTHELWPASMREELEAKGYEVVDAKGLPGVVSTLSDTALSIRRSCDGGKTWERRNIEGPPHFANLYLPREAVVLSDDTLIFATPGIENTGDPSGAYVIRSKDKGETWELRTVAKDATGAHAYNETEILDLPDGRLLAMMRHDGPGRDGRADPMSTDRYICRCFSDDGGLTWHEPVKTPIWGFPLHLLLLNSGNLLCSYAYRRRPFGFRACLSHDLGRTWDIDNEIIIRDDARQGGPVGMARSIQADDGTILTFYDSCKIGRVKPKSPYRWYPDDVHCFVGLSRFTENYVRARGQSRPPKEREETAPQSENILDDPPRNAE